MRSSDVKVGLKVRIRKNAPEVNERGPAAPGWNSSGKMDWTIDQVGVITEVGTYYHRVKLTRPDGKEEHWSYKAGALDNVTATEAKVSKGLPVLGHDYYRAGMIFKCKRNGELGQLVTIDSKIYLVHMPTANWWFRGTASGTSMLSISRKDMDKICEGKFSDFELMYLTFKDMMEGKQFRLERKVKYTPRTPKVEVSDGFYESKEQFEKAFPHLKFEGFAD